MICDWEPPPPHFTTMFTLRDKELCKNHMISIEVLKAKYFSNKTKHLNLPTTTSYVLHKIRRYEDILRP